jgi:glutathione S-transferase
MEINAKNSKLYIYGDYLSQPFRSIVCFCKIAKIPFEIKFVNIGRGEHLSEDYKKINRYGKIPSIKIIKENGEEFSMGESCSILRFLSEYYNVDSSLYPKDDIYRRAKIDQWLDWHHLNSRFALMNLVFKNVFQEKLQKFGVNKEAYETSEMVGKVLGFLNKILKETNFIVDDKISIADLIIACEIHQLYLTNYDISKFEYVSSYLKKINSIKEISEVNDTMGKISSKLKLNYAAPKF